MSQLRDSPPPQVSIIIPVVERHGDLGRLYDEYAAQVESLGKRAEFIFVVDKRQEHTLPDLRAVQGRANQDVILVVLGAAFGEAAALRVGLDQARAEIIVTAAAYLQVDPAGLVEAIGRLQAGADLVVARRHPRMDSLVNRLQTRVFHWIVGLLTGSTFGDISCGFRVMRRSLSEELTVYGGLHRFIPILALKRAPAMHWVSQEGPVHSLIYAGEKFEGRDTEVFAFYASPVTLGASKADAHEEFPGVVLIHGGGGTAFAEWTWLWAKRGYAAIAMDLSGSRPIDPIFDAAGVPVRNQAGKPNTRTRLPNGGPNHGHPQKFDSIGGDVSDDWPYHAVASVMRAHSLLRSFPEVNANRTAVTGISWGGYTTCLVASVDDRFQAAVPVYGCGFLYEGESVQKPSIDKLGERREAWIKAYDPSSLLVRCSVPILFVNGTNDVHYPLDSYQKSYDVVPGQSRGSLRDPTSDGGAIKQMRIEVNMRHGHPAGWAPKEIGLFIDSFCRGGKPLPVAGELSTDGDTMTLSYTSALPLKSATLHYTADTGVRSKRVWKSFPAEIGADAVTVAKPPADANTWFIALTDDRDAMVTTPVQFQP